MLAVSGFICFQFVLRREPSTHLTDGIHTSFDGDGIMSTDQKDALVIGNGPSVNELDANTLKRFVTYGTNHIYAKFDSWGMAVDNVVITDSHRLKEIGKAYQNFPGKLYVGDETRVMPDYRRLRDLLGRDFIPLRQLLKQKLQKVPYIDQFTYTGFIRSQMFDKKRFSFDYSKGLNFGHSVVISAIQIATIEGFKRILLTGVDSNYPTPKAYFSGAAQNINYVNNLFVSNPRMFMEPVLVTLQLYLETMDVELIDCTPGGKLKFITKGCLSDYGTAPLESVTAATT